MTYDTIEDGESTPLHEGGYSEDALSTKNKRISSSIIVRALMVGTTVAVGALLVMAGPLKMTTMNKSRNVDGMIVVSSATSHLSESEACYVAEGTFSGLSCKNSKGLCAGPGDSWGGFAYMHHYETCYVSNNPYPNDRCWSRSHTVSSCYSGMGAHICDYFYNRCDPDGYFDGDNGYKRDGIWHVSTPLSDGSCGNPCQEFK